MRTASLISVRSARPADKPRLKAILADSFEGTWLPHLTPAAAQVYRAEARGDAYVDAAFAAFHVAEIDGVVAGLAHWEGDFIAALHVHRACARRGVGKALMDRAERAIADAGFARVRLETDSFNIASQAFYLARGYGERGRYPDEEWNSGFTTVLYEKALG